MIQDTPTILVIFGATGDLMAKKIAPSLLRLFQKGKLPKMMQIIGFSRRKISREEFQLHIMQNFLAYKNIKADKKTIEDFFKYINYHSGKFDSLDDYKALATILGRIDGEWKTCANKLFYLAVPPEYYKTIFLNLDRSGLTIPCGPDGGWTRVLVEKPFGHDLETAKSLDLFMGKLFKEEQIYRIDHYLAKEMLQNILTFRFSNNILESSWNNRHIESICIRQHEVFGVESRGKFYDGVGALRDVGQNHLMQMLALVTMDHPGKFGGDEVRKVRAAILKYVRQLSKKEIVEYTSRGQYEGYVDETGVATDSKTETFFRIQTFIDSPRWAGVPIILEHGKNLKKSKKEIVVTFKHTAPCLCPPGGRHHKNQVVFSLEPKEEIRINFLSKKSGLSSDLEERCFTDRFRNRVNPNQYVEEYEKLLLDAISGNQILFVSTDEVLAMWKFVDPIIKSWAENAVPLSLYKKHSESIINEVESPTTHINSIANNHSIGVVGLGKMGTGIALQLLEKGWNVVGYNRTFEVAQALEKDGLKTAVTIKSLVEQLKPPRLIWIMVPSGRPVDEMIFGTDGLVKYLEKGDIMIDAGNSNYKDTIERAKKIKKYGIRFADAGVSGGPKGARYGACIMVGGEREIYDYLTPLYIDLTVASGTQFFEGIGAGHFVKMVHNGIEYGMMQAIAEGFAIMKKAKYKLDLRNVAHLYNHGSVVESRLIGWLKDGLEIYGEELDKVSGTVAHTGEGAWTVEAANDLDVKARIIEGALQFRKDSEKNPSYTGKLLSTMRNQFGGHSIKK